MAENETGTVMLPPAKTQEAFVHIGFAKAKLARGRAFVLAILAGAFVALGASFMLMVRADSTLSPSVSLILGGLAFCLGLFLVLVAGWRFAWACFSCSSPVPSCSRAIASCSSARSTVGTR